MDRRAGGGLADLLAEFEQSGVPEQLVTSVYRALQAYADYADSPVHADDDLSELYGYNRSRS